MKNLFGHVITAVVTLAIAAVLFGGRSRDRWPHWGTVSAVSGTGGREGSGLPPVPPPLPPEILKQADADERVNINVYARVNRSVVNITTESHEWSLFGEETSSGSGSGFIIDQEGNILTNFHVIQGALGGDSGRAQVTLFDGSTHDAKVVGLDPSTDVAVVRINVPTDLLAPVTLGDSSKLLVGQKVLAVGNPFGLERTLTTGIISSLDRSMRAKDGHLIKGIIQTDAAINPGNSGGPLLNTRGEVIGITTAIISQVGQSAGIGFAVPINAIKRILTPLIERGRVIRAEFGVKRVLVTDKGLLILDLVEGGPADRAGLKAVQVRGRRSGSYVRPWLDTASADLIVAIDGKPVRSMDDLLGEVEAHAPGDTVTVTVIRKGQQHKVRVALGESS
jgi:S1-C subfamily serine protease